MAETDTKVIHNRDKDNENNERDKKKAKKLEDDKMKSTPAPTGFLKNFVRATKVASEIEKPVNPRNDGKTYERGAPWNHTDCYSLPPYRSSFLAGGHNVLGPDDLSDPDILKYAAEAVKEYNIREFKDKIELVKVKGGTVYAVSGFRYDLTFDAKVLADGEGKRTHTYLAMVWIRGDGTLKVPYFNLARDAQGKSKCFWGRRC